MVPLKKPINVPISKEMREAAIGENPFSINRAVNTLLTPIIDPTERSIPPVSNTKVIPTAHIPLIETWRSTFVILFTVKKLGAIKLIVKNSRKNTRIIAYLDINLLNLIFLFILPSLK